jgi:hypothetical protein
MYLKVMDIYGKSILSGVQATELNTFSRHLFYPHNPNQLDYPSHVFSKGHIKTINLDEENSEHGHNLPTTQRPRHEVPACTRDIS